MERRPPSFLAIVEIVWKVACAILLIPALVLLVFVAFRVFDPVTAATAVLAIVIAAAFVFRRRLR